jgi:hypothetical protein
LKLEMSRERLEMSVEEECVMGNYGGNWTSFLYPLAPRAEKTTKQQRGLNTSSDTKGVPKITSIKSILSKGNQIN